MQTLKLESPFGIKFHDFCETVNQFYKLLFIITRFDNTNKCFFLPKSIELVHKQIPNYTDVFAEPMYSQTTWTERALIQNSECQSFFQSFCQNIVDTDEEFQLQFNFNGVEIICGKGTTVENMIIQWDNHWAEQSKIREEWEKSPEGIAVKKAEQKKAKARQLEIKKTLKSVEGKTIDLYNPLAWKMWVEANTDSYGKGVIDFAERWGILMQEQMQHSVLTKQIMDTCSYQADVEGITGFMYGCAVSQLSQCWSYGEQLRRIHNADYGVEGEGVVNPALLTITV